MPTIKTIKPGGGGDYTTLQAWEDFADGEAAADQWAECYTGGSLGALTVSGWTSTPSSSLYARVYVADGEGHGGDKTAGAVIDVPSGGAIQVLAVDFTRVEGLRLTTGNTALTLIDADDAIVDSILAHDTIVGISLDYGTTGTYTVTVKNCLSIDASGTDFEIRAIAFGTTPVLNVAVSNCTSYGGQFGFTVAEAQPSGTATVNSTLENCIAMFNSTSFKWTDIVDGTSTANNNISSDATADDEGGSGHLIDQDDATTFTDADNDDYTLVADSVAFDAGKTISGVTTDIIGTSRPQGDAYDIGAFETVVDEAFGYPGLAVSFCVCI